MPRKTKSILPPSLYNVHPAVANTRAVIDNLPANTGKSMEEWVHLVKERGPSGEKNCREWLKMPQNEVSHGR